MFLRFTFGCFLLMSALSAWAQDTAYLRELPIVIPQLQGEILLDGKIDEPAWQHAAHFKHILFEPVWNGTSTDSTELLVTYDDRFLYVAGRCYDHEPEKIVARNLVRDGWRGDDWLTFHVDAYGDKQNAVVFSVYPLGSRFDMATSNDAIDIGNSTFNANFNMIWDAKTTTNEQGWFVEMKIPLSNLRFKAKDGRAVMGISSSRPIYHKGEFFQFPAIKQGEFEPVMRPSLKQPVVFEQIKSQRLLQVAPYFLSGFQQNRNYAETKIDKKQEGEFQTGLDVKYGLSPYLTLDLTVNTDFAQAEVDNQQVNLSRFSLFFPERRLFFQEQAGLFEVNLGNRSQLFYSRVIGINNSERTPIIGGARLTGKLGKWDIGALNMQTSGTTLSDATHIPTENFGILRLRHKAFNDRSFVGFAGTSRVGKDRRNFAVSTDAILNLKDNLYFLGAVASTFDQASAESPNKSGLSASRVNFSLEQRQRSGFAYNLGYSFSGKDFDPGIGFVDRSNFHRANGALNYSKFAKDRSGWLQVQNWNLLTADAYWNAGSGKLESLEWSSKWSGQDFIYNYYALSAVGNYEYLADTLYFSGGLHAPPGTYTFARGTLNYGPPNLRPINMSAQVSMGSFFDGWRFSSTIAPIFNINKHLEIRTNYQFEYLQFAKRHLQRPLHLASIQLGYAANLHLSGSAIIQYNSASDKLFANARLRYNFRDGHDIYLVYNENFATQDSENYRALLNSEQQTLLLKYIYTFY